MPPKLLLVLYFLCWLVEYTCTSVTHWPWGQKYQRLSYIVHTWGRLVARAGRYDGIHRLNHIKCLLSKKRLRHLYRGSISHHWHAVRQASKTKITIKQCSQIVDYFSTSCSDLPKATSVRFKDFSGILEAEKALCRPKSPMSVTDSHVALTVGSSSQEQSENRHSPLYVKLFR